MGFEINTKNIHIKLGKQSDTATSRTPPASVNIPQKDYTYAPLRVALLHAAAT